MLSDHIRFLISHVPKRPNWFKHFILFLIYEKPSFRWSKGFRKLLRCQKCRILKETTANVWLHMSDHSPKGDGGEGREREKSLVYFVLPDHDCCRFWRALHLVVLISAANVTWIKYWHESCPSYWCFTFQGKWLPLEGSLFKNWAEG